MSTQREPIKVKNIVKSVASITDVEIKVMYDLMSRYYHMNSRDKFVSDLRLKDTILLIKNKVDDELLGFAIIQTVCLTQLNGKPCKGYYFGDSVADERLWGTRVFGATCYRYLLKQKLKQPFSKHYKLLLSKAYKTYLMMANNFSRYYPRYDKPVDAELKYLVDSAFTQLCGGISATYDPNTGLFSEHDKNEPVKATAKVAITDELRQSNPRICFYETINPDWDKGVHVACIYELRLSDLTKYILKYTIRKLFGKSLKQ